ncbi:hypothetical protein LMG27198_33980 [Methylocystis echinoides]|uniref:Uncharacterized protein n=1 Tax=Methylocystis echinoides TaxID=29468 RepID=A0A9W6GWK0_9HYPH|nr:hypothetical protein LMG27198_33980 [Methylocystis echinoides]
MRVAISKRPVLLWNFDEIYEDVFHSDTESAMKASRDLCVELLFLFDRAAGVERDLDKDAVLRAFHAKLIFVSYQAAPRMFRDHLEPIILWNFQDLHHRLVDNIPDPSAIFLWLSLDEIDSHERHLIFPCLEAPALLLLLP